MKINTENLAKLLKRKGKTQGEIAHDAEISENTLSNVKRGNKNMWFDHALTLAEALNASVLEIIADDERDRVMKSITLESGIFGKWIKLYQDMMDLQMNVEEEIKRLEGPIEYKRSLSQGLEGSSVS